MKDIIKTLDQHDKALNHKDLNGVMETFSTKADIVLLGTGPGEFYRGTEGVGAAYTKIFERFDSGSLNFETVSIVTGSHGDAAWFAATRKISGKVKNETKEFGMNQSGSLVKEKGQLRLAVLHHSFLKAGENADEEKG